MNEYGLAKKALKQVGCANASGDALRAMYARLILLHYGLRQHVITKCFVHLQQFGTDSVIAEESRRIMRDPFALFDVI